MAPVRTLFYFVYHKQVILPKTLMAYTHQSPSSFLLMESSPQMWLLCKQWSPQVTGISSDRSSLTGFRDSIHQCSLATSRTKHSARKSLRQLVLPLRWASVELERYRTMGAKLRNLKFLTSSSSRLRITFKRNSMKVSSLMIMATTLTGPEISEAGSNLAISSTRSGLSMSLFSVTRISRPKIRWSRLPISG